MRVPMTRRDVLGLLMGGVSLGGLHRVAAALAAPAASPSAARSPHVRWAEGWILWRETSGETLTRAIDQLHAVGADGIEYTPRAGEPDSRGYTREALLASLGERELAVSAQYYGTSTADPAARAQLIAAARERIASIKSFGAAFMVIGPPSARDVGADRKQAIRRLMPVYEEIGAIALAEGVQAGLHPHFGTLIETPEEIDVAMAGLDPAKVFFAPDTGHIHMGGGDVLPILRRYKDRIRYFHFKDAVRPVPRPHFASAVRELGGGEVDFPGVMRLLREIGYTGWINVEQDRTTLTPAESLRISFEYMRKTLQPIYS